VHGLVRSLIMYVCMYVCMHVCMYVCTCMVLSIAPYVIHEHLEGATVIHDAVCIHVGLIGTIIVISKMSQNP